MSKFCGKCGSPLNENGKCPKCDAAQSKASPEEITNQAAGSLPEKRAAEKPVKPTRKQRKEEKKAEKKRRKKEKRAAMTFGQKTKRFFLKLFAVIIALAILAGSVSCALVYFGVADIPFIEKIMSCFGYEKKDPDESDFASVPGKFTDEKITNADEAIKAAQNAASQLKLQTATDELSLLKEDTVGDLTYYRLQQNYQGIPVYGKTIVVVADKNGEAKGITSNAVDVKNTNIEEINDDVGLIKKAISEYLVKQYACKATDILIDENLNKHWFSSDGINYTVIFEVVASQSLITNYRLLVNASTHEIFLCNKLYDSYEKLHLQGEITEQPIDLESTEKELIFKDSKRNLFCFYMDNTTTLDDLNNPENIIKLDRNNITACCVDALSNVEKVYDYYSRLGLRSYDNNNSDVIICISKNGFFTDNSKAGDFVSGVSNPNNEYQVNGASYILIGEPKTLFKRHSSAAIDIVAHEFTHRVFRSFVGDSNTLNSNSVNEAYADIMGNICQHYYNENDPNWDLGENTGYIKYSMSQKKMFSEFGASEHENAPIMAHCAYLMYSGVDNCDETLSLDELSRLWLSSLMILPNDPDFEICRQCVEISASQLGFSDEKRKIISAAFDTVGIKSNEKDTQKYDTHSEIAVYDKNGLAYDDYTIVIDGQEFSGWFKWGWIKKDYHKEISVDSADPYELNIPKGDYTITIVDNFSGNKTYSKSIKAREDQELNNIDFATAFGFDYSVNANPELQVRDVNAVLYNNYTAAIKGKTESGTPFSKTVTVDKSQAQPLELETGKYSFLLTDNSDKSKTKSFSVRVRTDAPTGVLQIKTAFGKPYGEFDKSDLPAGVREFNGHYYYIYNVPEITTWEQAQEYCRSKNGYLATLTTREENSFAYSMLSGFNVTGAYFGLYDSGYNDWKWVNNEAFSYSNWADGEPNSYSEPYGMFYEQYVETWNDGDFGNYTSDDCAFICEWGDYEIDSSQIKETPMQRTTSGERDVVLCLDMSGSMAGDKLQQTKEAAIKFINTVLQEDASIAIVTYDGSARVLSDFSVNKEDLVAKINEISDGGSTNIEDGLAKSYNLLNYSNAKKQIIVLMSDGEPNEGKVGEELISYADSIKKEGVYIYTLGFFGGYSGQSAAQTLMEKIASDGCHYEVSDADSLVFFFGDIADTINGQEYIYIRIACPVDVKVSYDGETLNSSEEKLSTRTSFGSLTFEENTSESGEEGVDNRVKVLRLKADDKYDISIKGTGRGRMNYTIGFMDENGEYSDFRKFTNIRINKATVIDTVAAKTKKTVLNVDEDGDGKYDLKYKAGANERGEIVDYSYIFYIAIAIIVVLAVLTVLLIIKKKIKAKRRGN